MQSEGSPISKRAAGHDVLHVYLRSAGRIRESCVRINAYENQADGIFHRALARLFQEEKDAIQLIKQRELLSMLEAATDKCEAAAVLIENVLVKYA